MSLDQDRDSLLPPRVDSTPERQPLVFRRQPKMITIGEESPLAPIGRFIGFAAMPVALVVIVVIVLAIYFAWLSAAGPLVGGIWTGVGVLVVIAFALLNRR